MFPKMYGMYLNSFFTDSDTVLLQRVISKRAVFTERRAY